MKLIPGRKISILILLSTLLAGSVAAEEKHCSLIEEETERNACYAGPPAAAQPRTSKDWLVAKSKAFDSVVVTRSASREVMCADKVGTITLALMCKESRTSLYVSAGCQLGVTGDEIAITVRVDDQSANTETLTVPRNKSVLQLDDETDAVRFMTSLLGRERLEVSVTPPSHPPFTATFDLADLARKIQPLREACSW